MKEIGIEKRNGDGFLTDADGNRIEFVFNTATGSDTAEKLAVLIASDLQKLGMKVIFQPIEFNTLITKIDDTCDYDCILLGLQPGIGTAGDPSDSMNTLKSDGFTHQWFPREKTPSTDWEARIDRLMDAQMQTLDYAGRKKNYDEVQEILAEQQPMIFTVTPIILFGNPFGHRQRAPNGAELLSRDLERRGALFQEVIRIQARPNTFASNKSVPLTAAFSAWRTCGIWITTITAIKPNCANLA